MGVENMRLAIWSKVARNSAAVVPGFRMIELSIRDLSHTCNNVTCSAINGLSVDHNRIVPSNMVEEFQQTLAPRASGFSL